MSKKYFGTDGIRGKVGDDLITPDFVVRLGGALGRVLASNGSALAQAERPSVVIGKDTRISGYMLEAAFQAGLSAAGVDVLLTGPIPTPAVAYLTHELGAQAGIVITASHNPFEDNGIKFFSAAGTKLADATEHAIEAELDLPMRVNPSARLGKAHRINHASRRYIEFCKRTFPSALSLRGLRIVLDCAHGATYHVAPKVFHELGAEMIAIGNQPDGLNINNECGSTHPQKLQQEVLRQEADLGIAFDGDGDRVVMIDHKGRLFDGDELLFVIASHRQRSGRLQGGVVGTLQTNLAMEHAMKGLGIPFMRARVGDQYVLECMNQLGWMLGGENCGHIICLDQHSSGDGIISALQVLHAVVESGQRLEDLLAGFTLYPQAMINVEATHRIDLEASIPIQSAVRYAENELGNSGRVLLRASGTEPKVRVMVEGHDLAQVTVLAQQIADTVKRVAQA